MNLRHRMVYGVESLQDVMVVLLFFPLLASVGLVMTTTMDLPAPIGHRR